jgi:cytosine/adenosine deaminase-related metal-dependent hydrolase
MTRFLIRGSRVLDLGNDLDDPPVRDILIEGHSISAIGPRLSVGEAEVIDAWDMLAIPGFVNAHSPLARRARARHVRGAHARALGHARGRDGRATRVDEAALHAEIEQLMPTLRGDIRRLQTAYEQVRPHLDEVQRRAWATRLSINRFIGQRNSP